MYVCTVKTYGNKNTSVKSVYYVTACKTIYCLVKFTFVLSVNKTFSITKSWGWNSVIITVTRLRAQRNGVLISVEAGNFLISKHDQIVSEVHLASPPMVTGVPSRG
jgi:hypothetical protein